MKLGDFFKKVGRVVPIIVSVVPGIPSELVPYIVKGINVAEGFEGAKGSEKLALAVEEVNNGIAALNKLKPGSIDPVEVNAAVRYGIAATISTIKAIDSTKTPASKVV